MVDAPIIKIPINAADFDKFKASFDQYREAAKELPGAWSAQAEIQKNMEEAFAGLTAGMLMQLGIMERIAKNTENDRKETDKKKSAFATMAKDAKSLAGSVAGITKDLIKWVGIGGAISGLLGAGSFFGIDRLARSAGGARRQALGLGSSIGEQRAFEVNYKKYVDPDAFLENINQVAHDQSQQWGFGGDVAALSRQGKSTAEIATQLLPKLVDDFIQGGQTEQIYTAHGLGRFGTMQEFLRMAQMRKEFPDSEKAYRGDVATTGFSDQTAAQWQKFTQQMERAGDQIESVFVKKLAALEPSLEDLSRSVVQVVTELVDDIKPTDIEALGHWIEDTAKFLEGSDFKKDVREFVDDVELLGKGIKRGLEWLGLIPDPNKQEPYHDPWDDPRGPVAPDTPHRAPPKSAPHIDRGGDWDKVSFFTSDVSSGDQRSALLKSIAWEESRDNPNAVSPKGALGEFQFMPETARQYGLKNPFDPVQSAKAADHYLTDLSEEFGGNIEKVIAAYNWGPGNLEKDIERRGADWKSGLPDETSGYLRKVMRDLADAMSQGRGAGNAGAPGGATGGGRIRVENNTGGSAIITTDQVAI